MSAAPVIPPLSETKLTWPPGKGVFLNFTVPETSAVWGRFDPDEHPASTAGPPTEPPATQGRDNAWGFSSDSARRGDRPRAQVVIVAGGGGNKGIGRRTGPRVARGTTRGIHSGDSQTLPVGAEQVAG